MEDEGRHRQWKDAVEEAEEGEEGVDQSKGNILAGWQARGLL